MLNNFKVDFKQFDKPKKKGISGILRLKNDSEFVKLCIESCIDSLDELVIVHNDCNDESIEIIHELRSKYPTKIKIYEYSPKVLGVNLSLEEYIWLKKQGNRSVHLISNYCNYALSKCNYKFVVKIDSDQVYYSEKLKQIFDAYRADAKKYRLSFCFKELFCFVLVICYMVLTFKLKIPLALRIRENIFSSYFGCLLKIIAKYKISVYLSGINLYINNSGKFIPLGGGTSMNNKNSIPYPFNGIGDTPIFKLNSSTYFEPYDSEEYSKKFGGKYSIIERLRNTKNLLPVGVCWAHFAFNRVSYKKMQQCIFRNYPDYFLKLDASFNLNLLFKKRWEWTKYRRALIGLIQGSLTLDITNWLTGFTFDEKLHHVDREN